jgi:hypothetical protein
LPFTLAYHQAIDKAKIESKLVAVFREEINHLQALGFAELYFVREIVYPWSGLLLPFMLPKLLHERNLWQVGGLLQIIFFNPLLYNEEYDSYGHIMNLGVTLVTRFTDGTALITCGYKTERLHAPEKKIHCYQLPNESPIEATWESHQQHIIKMENAGLVTDTDLSLEKYTAIIQDSDRLTLFGKPR